MNQWQEAFLDEFLEAFEFRLFPVYVTLAILVGWLGKLTVRVVEVEQGFLAAGGVAGGLQGPVRILMWVLIATPFLFAAGEAYSNVEENNG
jgi:hypothetical protein